jgi:hypothetical protein
MKKMKNDRLIITGGNHDLFPQIKNFVCSLRENGKYDGRIVVCDNDIGGEWDAPTSYSEERSFTEDELSFFSDKGVDIEYFHKLVESSTSSRASIESINGYTKRHPYKFVYTSIISKKYIKDVNYICYFDSDVYFQSSIQGVFERLENGVVSIVPERKRIEKNSFLPSWIEKTDLSFGTNQSRFLDVMNRGKNYCTGFFGADASTFNEFVVLCWVIASSRQVEFYSDQPLVNILISFFNYPVKNIGKESVLHLSDVPRDEIHFRDGQLCWNNVNPKAIHFNGEKGDFYETVVSYLDENVENESYITGRYNRLKRKSKRFVREKLFGRAFDIYNSIFM